MGFQSILPKRNPFEIKFVPNYTLIGNIVKIKAEKNRIGKREDWNNLLRAIDDVQSVS